MPDRRTQRKDFAELRKPLPPGVAGRALALLFLAASLPARADSLFLEPTILERETFSSDANFATTSQRESDVISELVPSLYVRSVTKRLTFNANVVLDGIDYLHHSEPDRIQPSGNVDAVLEAVEKHLFFDAAAIANQERVNVFAATPSGPSTYNTFTEANYRFSPVFKGEVGEDIVYVIRADNGWVRQFGGGAANLIDSRLGKQSAEISQVPKPLGWTFSAESSQTDFTDSNDPIVRESIGRAIVKLAPDQHWIVSARGGVEQENYLVDTGARGVVGAGVEWHPSERTQVEAIAEHRFFGAHWVYGAQQRADWFIVHVAGGRDVVTTAQSIFAVPPGGDMATMLDAMLADSIPDPIERARAVQGLLAAQNLPDAVASAMTIFSPAPMLVTDNKAAITLLGKQTALSISAYVLRTEPLTDGVASAFLVSGPAYDNEQKGVNATITRHISPYTSLTLFGQVNEVVSLGAASGEQTRGNDLTLQLTHELSPRSKCFVGARLQAIESNVTSDAREKAAFLGISHRF
jgi:uncharacterized protein (PEP-CTERM system associated)